MVIHKDLLPQWQEFLLEKGFTVLAVIDPNMIGAYKEHLIQALEDCWLWVEYDVKEPPAEEVEKLMHIIHGGAEGVRPDAIKKSVWLSLESLKILVDYSEVYDQDQLIEAALRCYAAKEHKDEGAV